MTFKPEEISISNRIKVDLSIVRDVVGNETDKNYEIVGEIEVVRTFDFSYDIKIDYTIEIISNFEQRYSDLIITFLKGKIVYNFRTILNVDVVENNKLKLSVGDDYYKEFFGEFKNLIKEIYLFMEKHLRNDLVDTETKCYTVKKDKL